ncbi:MAG: PaaI family thioesterase [candidate division Zixibacteria bacterium]
MPTNLSPEKEAKIRAEFPNFPFPALAGFSIEKLEYGFARFKAEHRHELTQGMNILHGGVISALCDSAVAFALATMIDGGEKMLTIELKINFIAPADDDIFAEAKIIHKGRKTSVGEVEIRKSDNMLVAKALVTYYLYKEQT